MIFTTVSKVGWFLVVSIQLLSPASGEAAVSKRASLLPKTSFHSITFPSEWGVWRATLANCSGVKFPFNYFPQRVGRLFQNRLNQVNAQIKFPFNYFPQRVGRVRILSAELTFIRFPFNYFPQRVGRMMNLAYEISYWDEHQVSIQLLSPASGESKVLFPIIPSLTIAGFHSITFPSEWGVK